MTTGSIDSSAKSKNASKAQALRIFCRLTRGRISNVTTIVETDLEGGGYEQRYTIQILKSEMKFVRRPISIDPSDGTVCFIDNGPRYGTLPKHAVGEFSGGKWKRLGKLEPTHWTMLDD
jgi:hypothetical protein